MTPSERLVERDDFEKWADALETFPTMCGGRIVCYDDALKVVALDATEFVLKLIAAHRINRAIVAADPRWPRAQSAHIGALDARRAKLDAAYKEAANDPAYIADQRGLPDV